MPTDWPSNFLVKFHNRAPRSTLILQGTLEHSHKTCADYPKAQRNRYRVQLHSDYLTDVVTSREFLQDKQPKPWNALISNRSLLRHQVLPAQSLTQTHKKGSVQLSWVFHNDFLAQHSTQPARRGLRGLFTPHWSSRVQWYTQPEAHQGDSRGPRAQIHYEKQGPQAA